MVSGRSSKYLGRSAYGRDWARLRVNRPLSDDPLCNRRRGEADLIITRDSGHSAFDPPNSRALVAATDKFVG